MKTTDKTVSAALSEVWLWKDTVYEETKGMTSEQRVAWFRESIQKTADELGASLEQNLDGSFRLATPHVGG